MIFVSRFLAEENLLKFGHTVLSNTAKFQLGQDSATCVLSSVPSDRGTGNAGWVLPPLRTSLCSPETCALGVEVVAGGFAFEGTGEQKMEMESLQEAAGWEVETIRVVSVRAASSGEHKCYLTRTWNDLFWNIVYGSDDPCLRKINWCRESLLVW